MHLRHRAIVRRWTGAFIGAAVAAAVAPASALASHGFVSPVSTDAAGVIGNDQSNYADMTPDGRFVSFASFADNLVPGDTNGVGDVFVRDRWTGAVERVSVGLKGAQANGDSNMLGIASDTAISDDGRYVAFKSEASNLVRGDRNADPSLGISGTDAFVYDRQTGTTERVSVDNAGREIAGNGGDAPAISPDGRYVAFTTAGIDDDFATDVYLRDRQAGTTERISVPIADNPFRSGESGGAGIALVGDRPVVAFSSFASDLVAGDNNGEGDVFVRDLTATPTTELISVNTAEEQGDAGSGSPAISADGNLVAFDSAAQNFTATPQTRAFRDVFVRDRSAGTTSHETPSAAGGEADGQSEDPDISRNGRHLSFSSFASDLGPGGGDAGTFSDAFVRDRQTATVLLASDTTDHFDAESHVGSGPISGDGLVSLFTTQANSAVSGDGNSSLDVYAFDRRPAADLSLTKTDEPDPVAPRGALTYTLRVENQGPNPASDAVLVDTLPEGTGLTSASAGCRQSGQTVECALGTIDVGPANAQSVTITVTPRRTGEIVNTARVGASGPDPDRQDNVATSTTTVVK